MDGKQTNNESQFNMSAQLAQRLYSKYSDVGQIIPNRTKNMKKLRAKRNPKVKLPEISKATTINQPAYPPIHYPKGFERFSGLDKLHLTQTLKSPMKEESKLPSLSRVPSQLSIKDSKPNPKLMRTLAPSPLAGGPLLKHPLNLTKPMAQDDKAGGAEKLGLGMSMKSLSVLKKEQDYATHHMGDAHRRSVTQLKPLERTPKKEIDEENAQIVFSRDFGGSLSTKDLKSKMEDKDYLTPLDFIACCDRDPEFANRFCYCYRQGDFYDFRIVPFEKLKIDKEDNQKHEYMTVSASGIVHFNSNGEATFLTIPEWEREKILFQKLKQIRFFKQYFIWKSFSAWKTRMKTSRRFKTSETLSNELFVLDQELSKPLLSIRSTALSIANMDIVKMSSDIARNLEQFTTEQREHRKALRHELNRSCTEIKDKLQESCEKSMKTFKEVNRISLNEKVEADDEETEPFLIGDETQKPMLYAQEATKRTHYARLIKYVRLVDYIIMDSKLSLISNSVAHALEVVQEDLSNNKKVIIRGKMQSCPLFEIDCSFSDYRYDGCNLIYIPSMYDLREAIKNAVSEGIQLVCTNEQFLHTLEFINKIYNNHDFEDKVSGEYNDLINLAISSESISMNCQKIYDQIELTFRAVTEYSKKYQKYIDFHLENLKADCTEYKDHETFKKAINEHFKQQDAITQINSPQDILIYRLNLLKLINEIKPSPEKCLVQIRDYLPKLSFNKLKALCDELDEANVLLSRIPGNINEFVEIMKYLWKMDGQIDDFTDRFQSVEQLHIVMEEYHIKIPEKNRSKFKDTHSALKSVRQRLQEGLESGEANEIRFKKELDKEIPKLEKRIEECQGELTNPALYDKETPIEEGIDIVDDLEKEVNTIKTKGKQVNDQQRFLEVNEVYFESIETLSNDFNLLKKLWYGRKKMDEYYEEWLDIPLKAINVEEIEGKLAEMVKAATQCSMGLQDNEAAILFKDRVELMKNTVPIVSCLRDESLKPRHWEEINSILNNQEIDPESEEFTLKTLIDMNLNQASCEHISEIALKANKEAELEKLFEKVKEDMKSITFDVNAYKDSKDYFILSSTEEVSEVLEESLVGCSTILTSRFADHIRTQVEHYNKKLSYLEELLDEWMECQKGWTYLESIFHSPDISRSLPVETKKFGQLDQSWKLIMKDINNNPQVNKIITSLRDDKLETFKAHNRTLDEIQKALNNYLEGKRQAFSRFFFLSNNELLLILAEANRKPDTVQPHLRKLFENINRIVFGEGVYSENIIKVESAEKEELVLGKPPRARESVEKWLKELEESTENTVKNAIKTLYNSYINDESSEEVKLNSLKNNILQAAITVDSIVWCSTTEEVLSEENPDLLESWLIAIKDALKILTDIVRRKLSDIERRTVICLMTQDVHYRDIIEMIKSANASVDDFLWQQQLRYYMVDGSNVQICQLNSRLNYGYEYLGATTRLVITPLTDRCWMTITSALSIKLGAAPAGPAGTGKTESTKDLAKGLGKFCVVFNCSDQVNYKMMAKLFAGLSYTGSWTCLDEFNRINIEVLSVIAQQLITIRNAMLANRETFYFDEKTIELNPEMGVFVTMNPGYKGRTELPDNLKVLFRPVSMMIPDYALIAEIMLFSEGFANAKPLSMKMTKLYKLASEQLSQQKHYDFGMRAVKSVLVMAGQLKRSNPESSEDKILIRAMRDSNIPKFLKDDIPLFDAIVMDLFPGIELPSVSYEDLLKALRTHCADYYLAVDEKQFDKILQFYETLRVRFGCMIVGEAMTGKTVIYDALYGALNHLNKNNIKPDIYPAVEEQRLNPKSISISELYGEFSHLTQEWTDGLASYIIRNFVDSPTKSMKWILFDGPVDAGWIENMNTVLDDNMTLCLSNGERVKLKPEMKMIFECDNLEMASPATVSRCGMIYVSPEACNWRLGTHQWLNRDLVGERYNEKIREMISSLFENRLEGILDLFEKYDFEEPIPTVKNNLVQSLQRLIQILTSESLPVDIPNMNEADLKKTITRIFVFCLTWSIGASIDSKFHPRFESYLSTEFNLNDMPKGSVYDYWLVPGDGKEPVKFEFWPKLPFEYSSQKNYFDLVVPTKDTVRFSWFVRECLNHSFPLFFTGVTGVGKSIIINSAIQETKDAQPYEDIFLAFSSQTKASQVQMQVEEKLEKRRKNLLAGPGGKKVVIFIDDVNMPDTDEYGSQMPIELLRQFLELKGIYDKQLYWKDIEGTTTICAAAPPGGGRKALSMRFTRHLHMICLPKTSEESLEHIFKSIVDGFLREEGFKTELKSLSTNIVEASIFVYNEVSKELRPTPTKSHYTFNLRDISKIVQGILMVSPKKVNTQESIAKLWVHEASRVFHDRMTNNEDRKWFKEYVAELATKVFRVNLDQEILENKEILFGNFMNRGMPLEDRMYEEIPDYDKLSKVLVEYMQEYNIDLGQQLDLVLFKEACQHICRISRILIQPRGNVLLIGVGGCGKQTLTKMASYITGCKISSLTTKKNYTQKLFREDISQAAIKPAGLEGKKISLIINDNQITNEIFLEDVNSLLNSGEIPNLWENEDKDEINREMRDVGKKLGINEGLYNLFVQRVRDNLHIVLCLSPVGEALRTRIRMFPSLVNCCSIDWFDTWPEDALLSISKRFINNVPEISDEGTKLALAKACVFAHSLVEEEANNFYNALKRRVYITPKSYLDFINSYSKFLKEKNSELSGRRNTLFSGLKKLEETNSEVARLGEELKKLKPILEQNVIEQEKLSKVLEKDKVEAYKTKMIVEEEAREVETQANEIKMLQREAQESLDEAIPALESAQEAVNTLNQADIAELKTVKEPTENVEITFKAVAILLEEKTNFDKITWADCKKMLASNFFGKLKSYDKDKIPPKVVAALDKFVDKYPNFKPEIVQKSTEAGKSLCEWVRAILTYTKVVKKIDPLKQNLAIMNEKFSKAEADLNEKQDALNRELAKLDELKKAMSKCKAEKDKLDKEIDLTQLRLDRAEKLTSGLADEHRRWGENVEILDTKIKKLIGDVFISAACISYYGPFTGVYRNILTERWLNKCKEDNIDASETFELENVMGDPMTIMDWQIDKLPADSVSICNAIMIEKGLRKPFLIDPQLQGTTWLKNVRNRPTELLIIRFSDPNLQRVLENAIKMGNELMIEDMPETIDPLFEPIVNNNIIVNGGRRQIKLGDKTIDYDPKFKIYFVTSLGNPRFLPEIFIRVTVINFTVTEMGLSQQLLAEIVKIENAAVETKKNELTLVIANDQKRIKKLEDDILKSLANSSENILDDEELVANLDASKITSDEISKNLEDNKHAQVEIEQARSQYKVVADRGCSLFFIIASLSGIDPMYQYSLNYFIKLFKQIIINSEPSEDIEQRVKILINTITELVYMNICRGLFNTHKLIFSFLIAFQICKNAGEISEDEWGMLLRGVIVDKSKKEYKNPDPDLISEKQWSFILNLESVHENFAELPEHFERNIAQWRQWIQTTKSPTKLPFPGGLDDKITSFQRLLIFKALKPERLSFLCREFVQKKLGKQFSVVKPISMTEVFQDSDHKTPLTFILTQGADPTSSIMNFAKEVKGETWQEQIHIISLGQGQDKVALKKVADSLVDGCWVMLQNCHLYKSFMPELENQVLSISESDHNQDFRLFLTSMPCDYFPISVLQNSIKVTSEPPKGIKANLLGSVSTLKDKFFESCKKSEELKKFAFSICFFHAIVHERKKFGPLGWNIIYDFNESDFEASQTIIRDMLNDEKEEIAWDAIKYLTGEIIYGGRVTDNQDRRCMMSILETFINPAILEEGYAYTSSGIYRLPPKGTDVQGMLDYVQNLPDVDSPEVFGMNDNADIACLANESNYLLNTALSIQSRSTMGSASSQDSDQLVDSIAEKIISNLPELLTREGSSKELFKVNKQGLYASLTTYLLQEIERFNRLIIVIGKTLEELRAAIKGLAIMSEELDQMYNSILINKVPEKWAEYAYPSLKPLNSWIENLCERIAFIRSWLVNGRINKFWMPCFFFPQGFLTAILQEHARKYKIPIDELGFSFKLVEEVEEEDSKDKPTTEYIIYGLFLECGKINKDTFMLEDAEFGKNYTQPPPIKIIPTRNYVPDPLDYSCPLYKTSERAGTLNTTGHSTNFILMIELPSSYPPDHWIKRGTALLCQLDN